MTKEKPAGDERDGKAVKGADYEPPDLEPIIKAMEGGL